LTNKHADVKQKTIENSRVCEIVRNYLLACILKQLHIEVKINKMNGNSLD